MRRPGFKETIASAGLAVTVVVSHTVVVAAIIGCTYLERGGAYRCWRTDEPSGARCRVRSSYRLFVHRVV
jgi:hypothetical protein